MKNVKKRKINNNVKINAKRKIIVGLKKARSSIDRILQVLENEKLKENKKNDKCFSIIQQNLAVIGLLKSVNMNMLENHLDRYIEKTGKTPKQKRDLKKMQMEIVKILQVAQKK